MIERLDVDLEELVARIGLEHVLQGAPRIARRVERGAGQHRVGLAPQIGHGRDRAVIGVRGEEADDAQFALRLAVMRVELEADIIHMHAAVHARLDIGLGDDHRRLLGEESPHLRRHVHELAALAQHLQIRIAQEAKAVLADEIAIGVVVDEAVFAHAEEGEIIGEHPFDERDRLGDVLRGERRRRDLRGLHRLEDARPHGGEVRDGAPHLGMHPLEPGDEPVAQGRILDGIEMQMDEALAPLARLDLALRLALQLHEGARRVAVDAEDRMGDEAQVEAVLGDLGERRIEQERHIVVDRLDDRQLLAAADRHVAQA